MMSEMDNKYATLNYELLHAECTDRDVRPQPSFVCVVVHGRLGVIFPSINFTAFSSVYNQLF
jgi:hypothetical protein